MIDECYKFHPTGVYFKHFSRFKKPYDRAIVRLKEAGVFNHILSGYTGITEKSVVLSEDLITLKVEHYEGPFILLIICFAADIITFLLEVSVATSMKRKSMR